MQVSEHCKRWQSDASCWSCCDNMLSVRMRLKSGLWSVAETTLKFCSWLMHRLHCKWYALYRYMSVAWCERSVVGLLFKCLIYTWYVTCGQFVHMSFSGHWQIRTNGCRTIPAFLNVIGFLLLVVFINFFFKLIFYILTRETSAAAAL